MAKLPPETTETINQLKQASLKLIDEATALEFRIFEQFGETEPILSYLDEMKNVSEEAIALFSRLSTLQIQIARSQPVTTTATLELLTQAIRRTQARIPALERSIQEVKLEWNIQ